MLLNKVKSLPMRGLIAAISASVSMMFLAVIFINNIALSELKISGPIYQEIVREKDLLADILPPPNYVIEAYLVLTMLRDAVAPAERQDLTQRYQGLKRDYANRMAYWRTQPLPPDTADLFLRKSHELVTDLFATADQRLLPAILEGKGDVRQAYRAVSDLYERHRSTVDRIVARANEIMAETERNAAASERSFSTLTTTIAVAAFALLIGSLALLYYAVARPVGQAARMLARLAEGQDDVVVEQLQGNGEVPTLWRSVEALRQTTRQAFRQGQALDQMAAPIMMAEGPDLTITYINQCSLTLLRTLEQYLPCRADEVIGKSVDIFHANPAGPRRILSDPGRLPHVARVSLGPESMELRICPIFDRSGSYVGPLLAWELVTAQVTLVKSFEAEVGSVIADVTAEARKIADISNEMASRQESGTSRSITVADAADSTSTDIQNLAAAAEQLASSIDEISRQVSMASSTTRAGVANVDGVADQIARLKSAAAEIGGVVQLIHQIAGQTNLLALNATIEAARAGEAGKGFAVVASEVKALANQTAKATEEISRRIESIQEETDAAVTGFAQVRGVIGTVDEIASSIAAGVEEQSAVTKEITRSVASVTRDMQQVAGSISDVTMGSIRSGAGAINVLWSAESLKTASLRLSSASEAFLTRIKAF